MTKYYVGMDVHQASIVICVTNDAGKIVMESIIETKAQTVRDFIKGLRGEVHVTFEEGTQAAWLYDLIRPLATEVVVCNPRHNKLLEVGNKADRLDARKLAQLLRAGMLKAVYHGESGTRALKEMVRTYECLVADTTRVMNRIKAIYRSRGLACAGHDVYRQDRRDQWLEKLDERGVRARAASLYQQLAALKELRHEARQRMLTESRQHPSSKLLMGVPKLGQIRVAQIIATVERAAPLQNEAAILGISWVGGSDADECRVPGSWTRGAEGEARTSDPRVEHEPQPPAREGCSKQLRRARVQVSRLCNSMKPYWRKGLTRRWRG